MLKYDTATKTEIANIPEPIDHKELIDAFLKQKFGKRVSFVLTFRNNTLYCEIDDVGMTATQKNEVKTFLSTL